MHEITTMMIMRFRASAFLMGFLLVSRCILAQSHGAQADDAAVASLGAGFVSTTAPVNGITLHYVRGGTGPAVILLHGFPEDWYEYRKVMPRLTKSFTVVAVDLPGIGGSTGKPDHYDAADMAEDIHRLAQQLGLNHIYLVGHDVGGMVAYAFLRRYPETLRGAKILDGPLPGLPPWEEIITIPYLWHINSQQVPELPEELVAGRQAIYFRHFLDANDASDGNVAHYAESYAAPEHLHAAFEIYRAFPANKKFNAIQRAAIDVPVMLGAGEHSPFSKYLHTIAQALREHGCENLKTEVIAGSSHYLAEEQPGIVTDLIEKYASSAKSFRLRSGAVRQDVYAWLNRDGR